MSEKQTESKPPSVEESREEGLDETACSAFFIRRATPPTHTRWTSGRHGSGVRENAGTAATIMVCGIEWTSRVPRTETECYQTNAWAAKIISQNTLL
jgi:hypothetical protein